MDNFHTLMKSFSDFIKVKDEYCAVHSANVKQFSMLLADELGLPEQDKTALSIGSYLHDLGKIGIPDEIINKNSSLSETEYNIVKSHTIIGSNILNNLDDIKKIYSIVRNHHERYDGKGYPDKLKGNEIPLLTRIVSVTDAFDAMTTNRVYCQALSIKDAKKELINNKGRQFDPKLVDLFINMIDLGKIAPVNPF